MVVAGVHRSRRRVVGDEQAALRREVLLERPWKSRWSRLRFVKDGRGETGRPRAGRAARRATSPPWRSSGRPHRASPQGTLHVDRLGRRPQSGPPLAADTALDRPEQPRPAAGSGEDREQEEARRRLAVRSGDSRHHELSRRMVVELDGAGGHCGPRVDDDELRDGDVERPLDDERRAPRSIASERTRGRRRDRPGRRRRACPGRRRASRTRAHECRRAWARGDDPCGSECRRDSLQVHAGRVYQGDEVFPMTPVRHRTVPFAGLFTDMPWRSTHGLVTLTAGRRLVARARSDLA